MTSRRQQTALAGTALALVAGLLSSCDGGTAQAQAATPDPSGTPSSASSSSSSSAPVVPAATVTISPGDGVTKVTPDTPVTVSAAGGRLDAVTVTDDDGDALTGAMSDDGADWTSSGLLDLTQTYTVKATATNEAGRPTTVLSTLKTVVPKDSADFYLMPTGATKVGVGMPVVIQFAGLVSKDKQDDIERRVSVTTSPKVNGAWGWLDARQLVWRPVGYWKPGTKVSVKADLKGVQTRPGIWTTRNATTAFTVDRAMISTVDIKKHTMTVRQDGRVLRVIPITTGKAGFDTRAGTKVILSRETSRQMDAETTGLAKSDPEYYNIKVKYAMRLTWSGEFVHAAPWSVGSQGRSNVSHGCTGMSTANAKWLFDRSKVGDVVTYTGSKRALESYNGYTMWNMSLKQWATHSALA